MEEHKKSKLEQMFRSGKIGRRQFMEGVSALGLSAAFATGVVSSVEAATPKKGGTLRAALGHGSTTDSVNPLTFDQTFNIGMGYALRNHLTEIGQDGKIKGELAESFEASDDATSWVFNLRKDVEFHNGKTLDADDVIESLNLHRAEDSKSSAKPLMAAVKEIRKDGPDKVIFELEGGNADFPVILSAYQMAIMPQKGGVVDIDSGVGTGAFTLQELEPGVRFRAKRNPNYWKEGMGHFDEILLLSIKDLNAKQSALQTDEVDMIDRPDLKTVRLIKRNPNVDVEQITGTQHYTFPMHTNIAPFDNNDVRLALKYGIDREVILKTVLQGYGALGNDQPIAPANQYYADDIPQRQYDIDKAKFHMKKAGVDKITVDLSAADAAFSGAVDAAVLYKEQAAKAGIEINVVREPNDGYWSNVWLKKPWCACYWGGRPAEDMMFSQAYASGADWNDSNWEHERFNKILLEARAELDTNKRAEMYREMQMIVRDEGGVVIPVFSSYVWVKNKRVAHGDVVAGNWDLDGNKYMERWWFA